MVTRSCSAGLLIWSVRQLDHLLPQVFEAGLAECRRQHGDQAVELAKFVRDQRFECSIGEDCRIGLGLHGNIADVAAGRAEDADHGSAAIAAALENWHSRGDEPPEQIERLLWVDCVEKVVWCSTAARFRQYCFL